MITLPIEEALPELREALAGHNAVVLVAPPGAGKTTRVPLALLAEPWMAGRKLVMQEPRQIAARAAARRMAQTLGQDVGGTVGYRVRFDQRVGPATRIEVVTDGLYLRQLQDDPGLDGIGCVIFDELHERGLETDLALALTREAQGALRSDLRIVAMSATLEADAIARLLGNAPIVRSKGFLHPVSTQYLDREPDGFIDETVARAVQRALAEEAGSLLVFLPGIAEIRRVQRRLEEQGLPQDVDLTPLFGDLPAAEQDRAIQPARPGRRKIVLSTALAESSLTIEDVRVVIDCGQMRLPRFSPATGMSRLETMRVSQASADQRRGRAGRTAPGVCYRLWTEPQQRSLLPFTPPEIVDADLAPLALELAAWGARDAASLAWLTPPPAPAMAQARDLLIGLGAVDQAGAITAHGRAMLRTGSHPRLAHLVLRGRDIGQPRLAAVVAALLGERDIFRRQAGERIDPDLAPRIDIVMSALEDRMPRDARLDQSTLRAVLEQVRRLERRVDSHVADKSPVMRQPTGALVALAYPERVGQRRGGNRRFRLRNGRGAVLPEQIAVRGEFIAIADFDSAAADGRIHRFAEIEKADIEHLFAAEIETRQSIEWNTAEEAVQATERRCLGALILDARPLARPDADQMADAVIAGIRSLGLHVLPWDDEARRLRERVQFVRRHLGTDWPDWSDEALLAGLKEWLGPFLAGVSRRSHFAGLDLLGALRAGLSWQQQQELEKLVPTHMSVPSGSKVRLDYGNAAGPVLAVRIQEVFGLAEQPRILGGRMPLTLHLLSPARRPLQITQDLAGFWRSGYEAVRREMRGRYPRHYWPEDPLEAEATARVRPRG